MSVNEMLSGLNKTSEKTQNSNCQTCRTKIRKKYHQQRKTSIEIWHS